MEININCDLGESSKLHSTENDPLLLEIVNSANIACGYHAGDKPTMEKTIDISKKNNVSIGAHPSFKDTENFSSIDIKEFCLIYILINNLNFFYQRLDLLENIKFYKKENGLIFNQILECLKIGNFDDLQVDNQLLDQIEKYANRH